MSTDTERRAVLGDSGASCTILIDNFRVMYIHIVLLNQT